MALEINESNFQKEVLESDIPVLLDFWAPWCGPCRTVSAVIDELSTEYSGKVKVCKVNIDDASSIASQFGIMSIPTFILFNNGQPAGQKSGAISKDEFIKFINSNI